MRVWGRLWGDLEKSSVGDVVKKKLFLRRDIAFILLSYAESFILTGTMQDLLATMTTFIPSLTLPAAVFASPAASILLPIALGTAVGFSVQRTYNICKSQIPLLLQLPRTVSLITS